MYIHASAAVESELIDMNHVRETILETFREVAEMMEAKLVQDLHSDTPLLETGIDSLGFAVVVARLQEKLGFDPFTESEEPYYPQTVAEFVRFYEGHVTRHHA